MSTTYPAAMGLDPRRKAVYMFHAEAGQGTPQASHAPAQLHGQSQAGQWLGGWRWGRRAWQRGARTAWGGADFPAGEEFHEAGEGAC